MSDTIPWPVAVIAAYTTVWFLQQQMDRVFNV